MINILIEFQGAMKVWSGGAGKHLPRSEWYVRHAESPVTQSGESAYKRTLKNLVMAEGKSDEIMLLERQQNPFGLCKNLFIYSLSPMLFIYSLPPMLTRRYCFKND